MSVRMRHTKSHTANRRSHHRLQEVRFSLCGKCGVKHQRHTLCGNCGTYRGKEHIDVLKKLTKKEQKIKQKELKEQEETKNKSIDAEALSQK